MKILCWLGWHDWIMPKNFFTRKCRCCGKWQKREPYDMDSWIDAKQFIK